ncbi:ABC transporter substrate-binding protein [Sinorhizobium medicae]|uniref:ABC transporter substrate-binding protein n=1 Tax=Sinorhizobium medicae TaxID=110321 RepID=UPI000FD94AB4|nr:ABC transporter substrate-binding protein [Sinorhizobium medicae]MDX0629983.1 ABC transporter substrate-binding protein [Sinorhizobium medicae]MDX0882671.1 ABC transporter substrate-binding protein [Sinorhizobium medicae]RVH89903.1 ABC transporter substrate-binding protein [Sinorhizobium medicae]RVP62991.1 ABC transporter substrate-binding protein [Sinorhizobium medicae]
MITRRTALGLLATAAFPKTLLAAAGGADPLAALVQEGKLPAVGERLPKTPRVINVAGMGRKAGRHGGTIRSLIGSAKDIRLMTIYGYARLVGYDEELNLQPDVLESYETVEDRIFTFHLREGHRWSDGTPLTAEDFRYCFEDVLLNEDLSPAGLPTSMVMDGQAPKFEIVDERTVRYSWPMPNPVFLQELAAPQPLIVAMPSAYLKQFHKKYQEEDKLKTLLKEQRVKRWSQLHMRMARSYRPENPDLPTLDPWRNTTPLPAEQFVFERNPYYHRVDENGLQLPYIDRFVLSVSSSALIPAKTGTGESDLQANGIDFVDYTYLKDAEKRYPVEVKLWKKTSGSRLALLPNLNCADPLWRALLRDVRVRRALSLAIDRREINMAAFYGLTKESADTVLPESPLFRPEFATAWIAHDPEQANALLDAAGLAKRGSDGIRILPDGRKAQIVVETAGESTLDTDVLQLITDYWREVGISLFIRTSQRDTFRSRAVGGEIIMSIWFGIDNGVPTADMSPHQLAPTADDQLQWPVWGLNYISHGEMGETPDLPAVVELLELLKRWRHSADDAERADIWRKMLSIYTDQVFSIGLVNSSLQPILVTKKLRNFPEEGLWGFDPTSYFGAYKPDTFWLEQDD